MMQKNAMLIFVLYLACFTSFTFGAMYYPYRTITDDPSSTLSPFAQFSDSSSFAANSGFISASGSQLQREQPAAPCTSVDPYWCGEYVRQSIDYQTKYGQMSQAQVCQQLRVSLIEAVNGCCQTLRSNGCQ